MSVRVLILDDEPIVGRRLGPAIAKMGCETEVFTDPSEALARCEETPFDIIVTDIRMDDVDGIRVLERVLEHSPHTKVIMITGYATLEVAREALTKGAFDFLAKPFRPAQLREMIARAAAELGTRLELPDAEDETHADG